MVKKPSLYQEVETTLEEVMGNGLETSIKDHSKESWHSGGAQYVLASLPHALYTLPHLILTTTPRESNTIIHTLYDETEAQRD